MYNKAFEETFKRKFIEEVLDMVNEYEFSLDQAFVRVGSSWLHYSLYDENFVDGAGDHGIDFWYSSGTGFDFFQVKSHILDNEKISDLKFNNEGVNDLKRVKAYLIDPDRAPEANTKLKLLIDRWNYVLIDNKSKYSDENETNIINVKLALIIIGDELTKPAMEEFESFKRENETPYILGNNQIFFNVGLYSIKDIIEIKWREENREWKDVDGKKKNWIELHPEYRNDRFEVLKDNNSAVFYCPLIDLVKAYKQFGYQIFEPNVRCNIKKSKINADIKKSIQHYQSRKEFRFLNNGVTFICKHYEGPSENKPIYKIFEPGIVNGLQTVVAVSEAYNDLNLTEQQDFENNCYVLVRVLIEKAVHKIEDVVRSTNNQNKMEPRNLLSNSSEQILYEKLFAELGWFYERKQGGWNAFSAAPDRWRNLTKKRRSHFLVNPNDGRSKVRVVDNEEIAQGWVAFTGFSDIAIHEKVTLFESEDRYEYAFLRCPKQHASSLDYNFSLCKESSFSMAPSEEILLAIFLMRRFAKEMTLYPKENYEDAIKRLNIKVNGKSKDEIITNFLSKDPEYQLNSALSGMSFIFVEYFGYILYSVFGENVREIGNKLLRNGTFHYLKQKYSFDMKDKVISEEFEADDLLCVVWCSFKYIINEMLESAWAESFRTAPNRSRFIAQKETRQRIIKQFDEFNKYTSKRAYAKLWASEIKPPDGFYGYVRNVLK